MKSPSIIPYYTTIFLFFFLAKNHHIFGEKFPALASRNRALLYEGSATPASRAAWQAMNKSLVEICVPVSWVIPWVMTISIYTYIYTLFIYLSNYLFIYLFI
jgi:hypothetical protein